MSEKSSNKPTQERGSSGLGSRGKKYTAAAAKITQPSYSVADAAELLTQVSTATFDATAEVHVRINADTTQADQLVRTTVALPHGTGKNVRIAAFVPEAMEADAKAAGADIVGLDELIKDIEGGKLDFDVAVAVPQVMKNLGKVAKILGQKGLMPNPKAGTVTDNLKRTIAELKKGRIECKMDKAGIIHVPFGKISFGGKKLQENLDAVLSALDEAKPVGIKSTYITSITIAPTMGPGIRVTR